VMFVLFSGVFIFLLAQPAYAAVYALVTGSVSPSPTIAPSSTYTPSATPTETPTTTLLPLPAITLNFPLQSSTPITTISPTTLSNPDTTKSSDRGEFTSLSPRLRLLAVILVILWLLLISFAIVFFRQFK
jgi:hypothetical protein